LKGALPRFRVLEPKVDDDKWECGYPLASIGLKQPPEVAVLQNESREFFD
jgi:hypothetical protein